MEKNVGGTDRITRWTAGGALLLYGLATNGWRRTASLGLAAPLLWTASSQKCALNKASGRNTYSYENEDIIEESSEESFPASDAPAWAGNR